MTGVCSDFEARDTLDPALLAVDNLEDPGVEAEGRAGLYFVGTLETRFTAFDEIEDLAELRVQAVLGNGDPLFSPDFGVDLRFDKVLPITLPLLLPAVFPASTGIDAGDRIGAFCAAGRVNLVPLGVIELGLCVFGGVILLEIRGLVFKSLFGVVEGGFGRDTLTEVIFEVASWGSSGEGDFFDNV